MDITEARRVWLSVILGYGTSFLLIFNLLNRQQIHQSLRSGRGTTTNGSSQCTSRGISKTNNADSAKYKRKI
jgi:hypothetical protein